MAETGKSKTCVWRWQERFMHEGVVSLLRDKSRPPGKATHWTTRELAKVAGVDGTGDLEGPRP